MKLLYNDASPFARKVRACAIAVGLQDEIELVATTPWEVPQDLVAANPLSQVPSLLTDDGLALFDSPVICEFLDFTGRGALFPSPGAARWRALRQQAVADGLMAAALIRRRAAMQPHDPGRDAELERQRQVVLRSLDMLEADPPADHVDIGTISIACALGYLDFRFADEPWREAHTRLATWFAAMSERPEVRQTRPN